jgi:PIN domain nuclease of toxin-antitoxin system
MKYLVDTHILIWAVANTHMLSASAKSILSDATSEFFFSAASIWEIALKCAKHPDVMPLSAADARREFLAAGFKELKIDSESAVAVGTLPLIHGDPFDRLLIAQSRVNGMKFLSHDHLIAPYDENVVMV